MTPAPANPDPHCPLTTRKIAGLTLTPSSAILSRSFSSHKTMHVCSSCLFLVFCADDTETRLQIDRTTRRTTPCAHAALVRALRAVIAALAGIVGPAGPGICGFPKDFFETLGLRPALYRDFRDSEADTGREDERKKMRPTDKQHWRSPSSHSGILR